jgi:hypothetical protein
MQQVVLFRLDSPLSPYVLLGQWSLCLPDAYISLIAYLLVYCHFCFVLFGDHFISGANRLVTWRKEQVTSDFVRRCSQREGAFQQGFCLPCHERRFHKTESRSLLSRIGIALQLFNPPG